VPVEDEAVFRAVTRSRYARFDDDALVGVGREGDRAFERHVHRCHAERSAGQHEPVHTLRDRVADHVGCVDVCAGWKVRPVLLDAARGQDHERIALELCGDLGLREIDEISGGYRHDDPQILALASSITSEI
jgi:hypothetical protein